MCPRRAGDHPDPINYWKRICHALDIDTLILRVWVSASPENPSFKEQLLGSDAIVVGGGNTLNMMEIWKAQGIDKLLAEALDRGIVLAGGSAGSICWFEAGISVRVRLNGESSRALDFCHTAIVRTTPRRFAGICTTDWSARGRSAPGTPLTNGRGFSS